MAALKYSRQRESIKEYLRHTTEHPTADTVYGNIRKLYPNISLGTVYRNLSLLVDLGEIRKLSGVDRTTILSVPDAILLSIWKWKTSVRSRIMPPGISMEK